MMTSILNWLSADVAQRATSALLHFVWQGAAIAAIAGLAMTVTRRASGRHAIGVLGMAAMVAAPIVTFLSLRVPTASVDTRIGADVVATISVPARSFAWLLAAWMLGVLLVGLRAAGGFVLLVRLGRMPSRPLLGPVAAICGEMKNSFGLRRPVRFLDCDWLTSPAVVGWLRPVVYLPLSAMSGLSESQLRAVVAHELAHVKRWDVLVNAFQTVVEALLFYHPAVWWLSKRVREERENCCDDIATAATGDAIDYAHALIALEEARGVPGLAMGVGGGSLGSRIRRLLDRADDPASMRVSVIASALCLALACAAALCITGVSLDSSWNLQIGGSVAARAADPTHPSTTAMGTRSARALTADDFVTMRIHGIDGAYIDGLQALGYRPSVDDLVSMRIHEISPEWILNMRKAGMTNATTDQLIAMRIHGVTPEYIADLQRRGLSP